MKISFNPSNSNKNILDLIKNNKDIIFDLKGHSIFARGVEFKGTDTNTWRDIKINNVSIGSHTLDLRNGSNTTLTNTNGVVTINSTWRPVVDNLTSDSTTSSLSAKQGKVLKALIDGKSDSDHNHDGRYLKLTGGTMASNALITFADSGSWDTSKKPQGARGGLYWTGQSDYAKLYAEETVGDNLDLVIQFGDDNSNGLSIRNNTNTQTSYISAGGVITTGTFKGNLDWSYITNKPASYTPSAHTHAWNSLTHSSTTENQAILTNGKANGWKLYTLNISRWDNAANNAHSHANKSVLDGITSALVNSWKTAYNFVSNITGTDTDKVINKWEEIVNFLAGITEDNKLNTLLNSKLSIQQLSAKDILTTKTNNALFWVDTKGNASTITTGPFTDHPYALLSVTNYNQNAYFYRSRLAFSSAGDIKVASCHHEYEYQQDETWYNVLTSKNSGINGSTIKLNGTSITVYSSGTADDRYVKKSEVNSLLDAKLNRQNLSYGNWNPRGYHLAADYHYNGGDLSISESGGKIHVSVDGYFWQNEGQYRVLDTSDVAGLKSNLTVHQYLSATDAAWYPLVWGGNSHNNTSDSTGAVYKSYDKLSWQTSSQTLYATNIQTNNIKNLSIGGGIYWNSYVESASDGSDAASITLVRSGVAGGTTLVLSQMNDTNDTIQFKTNTAARLYHNSYPILTTQDTYVNNNKGYINGTEITQVNNADTLDGAHLSDIKNWSDRTASAYWKAGWYKVASAQTATNIEAFLTLDVNAVQSNGHATLFIRKRADSKPYFICTHNNNLNLADFRLYYNGMSMVLYARVPKDWNGRVFRIISEGREGIYDHIWTLYSNKSSTDPNAISAEGGNPYINPTYSGRVDWSNSSDKANYANSAGSVAWNNVTGKPSDILNYYWANVKISTSSSTTTSPTVSNLTATSSIKMSNISLEHTDEINNITNGGIHLNYRNSGNVSLCRGGGNVGIGTTTPSYKLHVNGQIMASGFHHASHNDDSYVLLAGGGTSHIKHGSTYWSTAIQFGNYVWLMLQIGEASNDISVVPTNISNPTKDIYVMNAQLGNYKHSRHGRYRVAPNGVLYHVDGVAGLQIYTTICYVVNS